MKRHLYISLAILVLFCGCSSRMDTNPYSFIQPGSIKAHLLSLSQEDLLYLNTHNPKLLEKLAHRNKLSIEDVISLYLIELSAETIILIIDHTSSTFNLSTSDVLKLQTEGIPFKVINHMIQS